MSEPLLDPDLREAARHLIATGRLRAESHPELYRTAVRGRHQLVSFFRDHLGWSVDVAEVAAMIRLHKRRMDVPSDRGPRLERGRGQGPLAPKEVLVCVALVCEQLWRRSRMSLRELLQTIAQVCAHDSADGLLPPFHVVAQEGVDKQTARRNRQHLVDALKLLAAEGTLKVDSDLDHAVDDEDDDLVVTASRDLLASKFSSLSPVLLGLDDLPPERHTVALSADFLPNPSEPSDPDEPLALDGRRLRLLRRLVDDPATDPVDDPAPGSPYLHTLSGRERALNVIGALGFTTTVRRDWWCVADPTGVGTDIEFPNGRRTERQAALALLSALAGRDNPTAVLTTADVLDVLKNARQQLPHWAAAYSERLSLLARAATNELVEAGLLRNTADDDTWQPTPGIHLWKIQVRHGSTARGQAPPPQRGPALPTQTTIQFTNDAKGTS
jgi:uncharacterized protein (TIGR02678 family)